MAKLGIKTIALADTTGSADKESITKLFGELIPLFPDTKIGAHFHSTPAKRLEKIQTAWESGCRRFDVALQGYGGCPFATDDLTGNTSTESLLAFCASQQIETGLDGKAFAHAGDLAAQVFEVG